MKLTTLHKIAFLVASVLMYQGCSHHGKSRVEEIKESNEDIAYKIDSDKLAEDAGLKTILTEIGQLDSQFLIAKRSHLITNFECRNCHTEKMDKLLSPHGKKAHWDLKLDHAGSETMDCRTCHNMDKPDVLTSLKGATIPFDHSYKQCAQCHSTQYKDWQGGAHGKSLLGWVPPRVSQTCTGCHNPHKPAFEQRWPSRLNTVRIEQEKKLSEK